MTSDLILGIESSCDETAAAVVADGRVILSSVIASQADLHSAYGGVVPEIASRMHVEAILPVIDQALEEAGKTPADLSAIAVTYGPGLVGALLVGLSAAKGLAWATDKPLIGVHHIEGHIAANYLADPDLQPPFLCLVVSGAHSHLVLVEDYGRNTVLARTRDDAAGEAFDKIARAIGLGYPGGPLIDRAAEGGRTDAFALPRSRFADSLDFSFSGLKTAALNQFKPFSPAGGKGRQRSMGCDQFAGFCRDLSAGHCRCFGRPHISGIGSDQAQTLDLGRRRGGKQLSAPLHDRQGG
jgi:N6-L-threonylcarbamoyladenine synthase